MEQRDKQTERDTEKGIVMKESKRQGERQREGERKRKKETGKGRDTEMCLKRLNRQIDRQIEEKKTDR
jgi:hypothetical protein